MPLADARGSVRSHDRKGVVFAECEAKQNMNNLNRREFVSLLSVAALGKAFAAGDSTDKPLRGIFPIAQTPFTDSDRLDLDALAAEVKFIDRAGCHGMAWPQMASEYSTLTEAERLAGAEAIVATGKRLRPAIIIGVQGPDLQAALRYARHAAKLGADGLISLPPVGHTDADSVLEYYKAVGKATSLPLFMQTTGDMSIELVLRASREIPTLGYVKDEAGRSPLARIGQLNEKSEGRLHVFTGNHGSTLIDEMRRGSAGCMPAASVADLYAQVWDFWQKGRHKEAMDLFGKTVLFIPEMQAYGISGLKYILHLRGVFPNYAVRTKDAAAPLDASGKAALGEMLEFVKPWLRA